MKSSIGFFLSHTAMPPPEEMNICLKTSAQTRLKTKAL